MQFKLRALHAIIRSKLLYGLETAQIGETPLKRLKVFKMHQKTFRIKTTFIDRSKDNETVRKMTQDRLNAETRSSKELKQFSTVYTERKIKLLNKIITAPEGPPMKSMTFQENTLKPTVVTNRPGTKRRWGKPRTKWVETGLETLWKLIGETLRPDMKGAIMNLENPQHVRIIKEAAAENIHTASPQETKF